MREFGKGHLEVSDEEAFEGESTTVLRHSVGSWGDPSWGISWKNKSQWARTALLTILKGSGDPVASEENLWRLPTSFMSPCGTHASTSAL